MRQRRHHRVPAVEGFEVRALLSAGIAGAGAATAVVSSPTPPLERVVHLDGTLRGGYHRQDTLPDVGSTFNLIGSGHVDHVGRAFVTGSVHTIGNIASGHAGGTLFLSGVRGTITLKLVGPEQDGGPKGLPDHFDYSVVGGTGAYRNVSDTGTASLVTIPGSSATHRHDPDHGTFALVLTSTSPTA